MRLNKSDVSHIASFKEGAFKSWQEIVQEVKDHRLEQDARSLIRAEKSLGLTFN